MDHNRAPAQDDEKYMDSDDEEDTLLTHAEHKENGNTSYKAKDYRAAIAHYTLAIETAKAPFSESKIEVSALASYYSNRAAAFSMLLQYDNAINDCDEAIKLDPTFTKAYFRKARTLTTLGRVKEAIKAYSLGMIHDPNNATVVKDKSDLETLDRRFTLAKQIVSNSDKKLSVRDAVQVQRQLDLVLKSCPAWKEAIFLKAQALYHLRKTQEAYALTTTLVRMGGVSDNSSYADSSMASSSHDPNVLVMLRARILFQMGNLDDSVKHLRQILGGDPDNKQAFTMLKFLKSLGKKKAEADEAYKTKNFANAISSYGEAIQIYNTANDEQKLSLDSPTYVSKLYFNRASSNANLRKHSQAIQDCTSAIDLDESYLKAYMRRAASHLMIGEESDCTQAIRDYDHALNSLNPSEEQSKDLKKKLKAAQVQLKRSKRKDFYKILGVPKDATDSEIKKCYRKLALKWHPDRHASSTEEKKKEAENIFRDVNLAYEVLSDPTKKRRYDDGVEEQDLDNPHATAGGRGHGMGGIDPNDLFNMFMRQQSQGGRGGGHSFHFG